jgi:hypothetical protein
LLLKSDKNKRLSFFLDAFQPKVTQKESWILIKTFSVCRAFNSEHFDKKVFGKHLL